MATNNNFNLSQNLFLQDFISKELFWFNPSPLSWNSSSIARSFISFLQSQSKNYNDFLSFDDVKDFILNPFQSSGGSFSRSVSSDKINQYLDNIEFYQSELNKFTSTKIELTYYQIFGLFFTEYFLDQSINNPDEFSRKLNDFIVNDLHLSSNYSFDDNWNLVFNSSIKSKKQSKSSNSSSSISSSQTSLSEEEREESEMLNNLLKLKNKLVFWMATGSWKTFMMMINTLQYLKYVKESGNPKLKVDNVLVITPNKDLSDQHFAEFNKFGFFCNSLINKDIVKFIEITKFKMNSDGSSYSTKNKNKEWTFDALAEYGDTNNLILIDEWHKAIQSGKESSVQKRIRDAIWIKPNSFTFEYSATYWQAVSNSDDFVKSEYSNSVIWNYSYKFFRDDKYGKDFVLDNEKTVSSDELDENQMIKILLSHVQQSVIYNTYKSNSAFKEYNIEKPLITIFWQKVSNWKSKTASDSEELDVSEVNQFINFLWKILQNKIDLSQLESVLENNSSKLVFASPNSTQWNSKNITGIDFSSLYSHIESIAKSKWLTWTQWTDFKLNYLKELILKFVFELKDEELSKIIDNNETLFLEVEKMKNNDLKEIWLRVSWQNNYFGLVYVWNPDDIINWIKSFSYIKEGVENNFRTQQDSLFRDINNSWLSMIVWSKKFIMWWNNYRVSTMGLLEIGIGEGPTIIQVLWRWVRLKWKNNCLKREENEFITIFDDKTNSPKDIPIKLLQSLNIIWINANFMDVFVSQLAEEWITTRIRIDVPTKRKEIPSSLKILVPNASKVVSNSRPWVSIDSDFFNSKSIASASETSSINQKDNALNNKWNYNKINILIDERSKKSSMNIETQTLIYSPEHESQLNYSDFIKNVFDDSIDSKLSKFINWERIYLELIDFKQSKYKDLNNIHLDVKENQSVKDYFSSLFKWLINTNSGWTSCWNWNLTIYPRKEYWFKYSLEEIGQIEKLLVTIFKQLLQWVSQKVKYKEESKTLEIQSFEDVVNKNTYKLFPEQFIEINQDDKSNFKLEESDIKDIEIKFKESDNHLIDLEKISNLNKLIPLDLKEMASLYTPLFGFEKNDDLNSISSYPVALNKGEYWFVQGLEEYLDKNKELFRDSNIYLLRNPSKTWIWFYWDFWGFYPDFIVWKINKITNKQEIHFVDPKWLRNLGKENDKVLLFKELEKYSTENLKITSWLYSVTKYEELRDLWIQWDENKKVYSLDDFRNEKHILFENDFSFLF